MERSDDQKQGLLKEDLNFNRTVTYKNGNKYTGEWKNGLKVGNGSLENYLIKFEVKIKEGKFHKCLKVLRKNCSIKNSIYEFFIPNIRIIKEKDYYQEEISDKDSSYFLFGGNRCLFDGKCFNSCTFKSIKVSHGYAYILQLTENKISPIIVDLEFCEMRFIGPCFNLNPNGICKIIYNRFTFKGNMKGLLNIGNCTVKNEYFKALIGFDLRGIRYPFNVISKELGFEILVNYSATNKCIIPEKTGKNLEIAYNCLAEISEFVYSLTNAYNDIIKLLSLLNLTSNLISYSLVVDKNWKIFECDLRERNRMQDYSQGIIRESNDLDEKCYKVFYNNERYEGKVVNGKFEGFGKYSYADGSVYLGEFKKNLRSGLGTFKYRDRRLYKGYWVDNMMHGKGFLIDRGNKIYGVWNKNQLIQGGLCVYNEFR